MKTWIDGAGQRVHGFYQDLLSLGSAIMRVEDHITMSIPGADVELANVKNRLLGMIMAVNELRAEARSERRPKYDEILAENPNRIIVVRCRTCDCDYDIRVVSNEVQHSHALHVVFFDCPEGHHCEARRMWKLLEEVKVERRTPAELRLLLQTVLHGLVAAKKAAESDGK